MTVAGCLGTAKRQMYFRSNGRGVYIKDAGIHIVHGPKGAIDVAGIDRRGKTIANSVGDFDSFVQRLRRNHSSNWSKDLFLRNAHVWSHVGEYGWFNKIAASVVTSRQTFATAGERRAIFILANVDVIHDLVDGIAINNRSDVGLWIGAITYS